MRRSWPARRSLTAALAALASCGLAYAADDGPLMLARDGHFYVGGQPTIVDGRTYVSHQMYVEVRIPAQQTHRYPIVMVHGGTMSGTNFTGTPDGREGWAQYFVRQGYAVYVVDQPGRGRSGYLAAAYGPARVYFLDDRTAPEADGFWIWGAREGDIVFDGGDVVLRNGGVQNDVTIRTGDREQHVTLQPGESRGVSILPAYVPHPQLTRITTSAGFRPADVDPHSRDQRFLGVYVVMPEHAVR